MAATPSPSDQVGVTGNTSGATDVKVINVAGAGAQTVAGIKIIDVGVTSSGTFTLLGDYLFNGEQAVVGGAYSYMLRKNGVSTPTDGDWYLRSELTDGVTGPVYQPGVPLYGKTGCPPLSVRWLALHCASEGCSGWPSRSSWQEDEPWQIIEKHLSESMSRS